MTKKAGLFSRDQLTHSRTLSSEMAVGSPAVTHFAIIVPGTGPHTADEKPKGRFMKKAKKFTQMCNEICKKEFADTGANVELVPIEYHADIHSLESTNAQMDKVTLPSIPWIRTLDNDVIGDILYYFSTFHGQRMLKMVITKLNTAYKSFTATHPHFNGTISLIAHSLGGLICYEILYYMHLRRRAMEQNKNVSDLVNQAEKCRYKDLPDLLFMPDRLFTLGSPMGGIFVFRHLSFDEYFINPVGYHNIFHPYDPFGYRTEPLVDAELADTPAVPIMCLPESGSLLMGRSISDHFPMLSDARPRNPFTGSVVDFGKSFVDTMTAAPVLLSSTMLKAAKTSVVVPFNAMANKSLAFIHVSSKSSKSHKVAESSSTADSVATSVEEPTYEEPESVTATSYTQGLTRAGSTATTSYVAVERAAEELSRDLYTSQETAVESAYGQQHQQLATGVMTCQGQYDHRQVNSYSMSVLSSSISVAGIPLPSGGDQLVGSKNDPTSSSRSPSPVPQTAADTEEVQKSASSSRTSSLSSTAAAEIEAAAAAVAVGAAVSDHSRMAKNDGEEEEEEEEGDFGTDMLDHIRRIFKPTKPPSEDQRLAEFQGLPLSSRLMSMCSKPLGTQVRSMRTMPIGMPKVSTPPTASHQTQVSGGNGGTQKAKNQPLGGIQRHTVHHAGTFPLATSDCTYDLAASHHHNHQHYTHHHSHHRCRCEMPVEPAATPANEQNHLTATGDQQHNPDTADGDEEGQQQQQQQRPLMTGRSKTFGGTADTSLQLDSRETSDQSQTPELEQQAVAFDNTDDEKESTKDEGSEVDRLPYSERMDYIIPFSKRHLQNEYWLGLQAHFSYWTSKDVAYHILYHMINKPVLPLS
ncbi:hypothetical protein GQ54DRAFT_341781 [Martensiomyces pterosporus]|nr:hypothetical protein GQ54DRAFT_341781 [Martensiomyces pterosporus]